MTYRHVAILLAIGSFAPPCLAGPGYTRTDADGMIEKCTKTDQAGNCTGEYTQIYPNGYQRIGRLKVVGRTQVFSGPVTEIFPKGHQVYCANAMPDGECDGEAKMTARDGTIIIGTYRSVSTPEKPRWAAPFFRQETNGDIIYCEAPTAQGVCGSGQMTMHLPSGVTYIGTVEPFEGISRFAGPLLVKYPDGSTLLCPTTKNGACAGTALRTNPEGEEREVKLQSPD